MERKKKGKFEEGWNARKARVPRKECPYPPKSVDAHHWLRGWYTAQGDGMKKSKVIRT